MFVCLVGGFYHRKKAPAPQLRLPDRPLEAPGDALGLAPGEFLQLDEHRVIGLNDSVPAAGVRLLELKVGGNEKKKLELVLSGDFHGFSSRFVIGLECCRSGDVFLFHLGLSERRLDCLEL